MANTAVVRWGRLAALLALLCHAPATLWAAPVGDTGTATTGTEPHGALGREFDYVVVGGGPGGLTVASRLSEDPSVSVAVVEAGTFIRDVVGNLSDVPGYDARFQFGQIVQEVQWGFQTTPQAGLNGAVFSYPRGKALGGSTAINFMAHSVTAKGALQKWADLVQDPSYSYDNVQQYYRRSIGFSGRIRDSRLANATPSFDPADVGSGQVPVTFPAFAQSWSTWAAKGLAAIGIKPIGALLHGELLGSTWQVDSIDPSTGLRADAATAYLFPNLGRKNLAVFNKTLATRVLFDSRKAATGVQVSTNNVTYTLRARREVILAAGAFQTPQLLQVSGVGPASLLRQFNIPVVADLPGVGQSMNDHVAVPVSFQANLETGSTLAGERLQRAIAQFNADQTGPLASPGGDFYAGEKLPAEVKSKLSAETRQALAAYPADWPDVEYLVLPNSAGSNTPLEGANYVTLLAVLQAPQSRGNVSIASASMLDKPLINPNWLTARADQEVLVAGLRRARQAFAAIANITVGPEFWPGAGVQTDEQLLAAVRSSFFSMSHAASTCRMGTARDKGAVVDSHGKVFGVRNLRVADASVFPLLLPGPSVQATVYMLAEKLADDIKRGK